MTEVRKQPVDVAALLAELIESRMVIIYEDDLREAIARVNALEEALMHIDDMCTAEINARFPVSMRSKSEAESAKNSKIYPLLVMPRNIARAALLRTADRDAVQPSNE